MELKNKAMIRLLDAINKYHKELLARPADKFTEEDRLMMRIIVDLKEAADKHVSPKER